MQFGMDEARLRQQSLGCGLVVRLGRWREVRVDLDSPTIAMATARMDRETLEVEEDLDVILSELDPQLLVTMDVGCAVEHRLHHHIAIGVQRRCEPLTEVD